jgi:hypothetical protein
VFGHGFPPIAQKTLQDVVHWQILEGKTSTAKRGFFPGRSSPLKFPLVARMSWRGLRPEYAVWGGVALCGLYRRERAIIRHRLSDSNRTILAAKELRHIAQTLVRHLINPRFDVTLS